MLHIFHLYTTSNQTTLKFSNTPKCHVFHFTLLSVLAALAPPSACATGAVGAGVGLMAETVRIDEAKGHQYTVYNC